MHKINAFMVACTCFLAFVSATTAHTMRFGQIFASKEFQDALRRVHFFGCKESVTRLFLFCWRCHFVDGFFSLLCQISFEVFACYYFDRRCGVYVCSLLVSMCLLDVFLLVLFSECLVFACVWCLIISMC